MSPLARTKQFSYTRLKLLSRPVIALPLVVLIVFVIVSVVSFFFAQSWLDSTRDRMIDRRVQEDSLKLKSALQEYTLIAAGGAGFAQTADVTEQSWNDFVNSYNIPSHFPSINSVAYAQAMNQADAQAFVDQRNQDLGSSVISLDPAKSASDLYVLLKYTDPDVPAFATRIGLDEYDSASRKAAIDEAISENHPVLTSQPQNIQPQNAPKAPPQQGFVIFAPIYDKSMPLTTAAQRRAALLGTSNVSFQTQKFFDAIYGQTDTETHTYLAIYQGGNTAAPRVYEGGVQPKAGDSVDVIRQVGYGNQTFTFAYKFSDSDLLSFVERNRPASILYGGLFLGVLLSMIMLFSIRARLHKISFDKEREVQLAKDELLSLASHQLRTPATGVKQYMGMVLQGFAGEITPQQREFLQKAYESNDRQLHIINDILHLAKLDAGRIVLSKTTFDMSELVRSVVDEQTESAHEAEVTLRARLPKRLPTFADSHMMRMVVENLVSNGIKYTNPGGTVTVTLRKVNYGSELTVKDTGVGIAEGDLDKLFKQFSRVANERSHLVSGTGVGLYLVKNLVELHGGSVTVASKLGKGTTFTVTFPYESPKL